MENNKVKVAVIQESKLTPKSKNPCIQNYTTVRKARPHGQGGGLLIFIHRSVTFSKQPSLAESLYDPHLEELAIVAEIGNTKLIISNIYIPPASSCSNGYQSSIEHLLTTKDSLILGEVNAHHPYCWCCCLPTPMTLVSGESLMFPLVVHQPASPSIWSAVQSLRRGLSTNPGVTMWCICGCS